MVREIATCKAETFPNQEKTRKARWFIKKISGTPDARQLAGFAGVNSDTANKPRNHNERTNHVTLAITFLVVALIAGLLGFSGLAGAATGIAQILFAIFLVLFLASFISRNA